jgi:type IX secretion system PorP/SprF family membrane protein
MRTLISIAFVFLALTFVNAQYVPYSAQNFHLASLYNPAFAGIENFVDVKVGYRYQWAAFKDAAPQFGNISVNFRVKQPLDMRWNALRPSRTDFSKIIPRRKLSIHGLGVNVYSEMIGPFKATGAGVHYAVHFPVSKKAFLSGGIGAMLQNSRIDQSELYWGPEQDVDTSDPIYQKVMSGGGNHSELWTRAGLLFYTENFYLGATYYPWNTTVKTSDVNFKNAYYRAGIQTGLAIPLNEDFTLKPSIWALWMVTGKWAVDYGAKFYMQDKTWFGLTYRDSQSGVVSGGFNVSTLFSASYAYEFPLGRLRTFSGGSHELMLALRFRNFKKDNQRVW